MRNSGNKIIFALHALRPSAEEKLFFKKYAPAGIILFKRNLSSVSQIVDLIRECQELGGEDLLIAIDQEGGSVLRLPPPFSQIVDARSLAQAGNLEEKKYLVGMAHSIMASELNLLNINLIFVPLVDIYQGGDLLRSRAMSDSLKEVIALTKVVIDSYAPFNILTCAKHFPGHGVSTLDSHYQLPTSSKSLPELEEFDLLPFAEAIHCQVPLVMMAHLIYTQVDSLPASLSPWWSKYLRQMNFSSLIISDDLTMQALKGYQDKLAYLLLKAQVDLFLTQGWEEGERLIAQMNNLRRAEEFDQQIDRDAHRIEEFKKKIYTKRTEMKNHYAYLQESAIDDLLVYNRKIATSLKIVKQ